jgi:hypothetical protein
MLANPQPPRIHLPKAWQDCVKSAVLHGINARVRLAVENDRLHEELALLREGTTFTAQIVAFNTTALALPLIALGFVMTFIWKNGMARHYGAMLLGLGLIFYGMGPRGTDRCRGRRARSAGRRHR